MRARWYMTVDTYVSDSIFKFAKWYVTTFLVVILFFSSLDMCLFINTLFLDSITARNRVMKLLFLWLILNRFSASSVLTANITNEIEPKGT